MYDDSKEHQLAIEFIDSVLPVLFEQASSKNTASYMFGSSPGIFHIQLGIKTLLNFAPRYNPNSNRFIHFTSLKALHSILNELNIRMYNLDGLNDPKEFSLIAEEFEYPANKIDHLKRCTYVFSMCDSKIMESDNILDMWRFYGQNGYGCAIEFEIENINNGAEDVILSNVIYNKLNIEGFNLKLKEFEYKNNVKCDTKDLIEIPACLHKSAYFKTEQEIRMVHTSSIEYPPHRTFIDGNYAHDFNSRNKRVSYFKLNLYQEEWNIPKLSICKIHFGFRYSKESVSDFRKHLEDLYVGINHKLNKKVSVPEILPSPLIGMFY